MTAYISLRERAVSTLSRLTNLPIVVVSGEGIAIDASSFFSLILPSLGRPCKKSAQMSQSERGRCVWFV